MWNFTPWRSLIVATSPSSEKLGISVAELKSADDLFNLGKELTHANSGVWAFDDMFGQSAAYASQLFQFPNRWAADSSGKLFYKYESEQIVEALNWQVKIVKAGYVHPDALANANQNGKQRFWSGKVYFEVSDTGHGFEVDGQGRGLQNMRDRIRAVGGDVTIVSAPDGLGTTVSGWVPT